MTHIYTIGNLPNNNVTINGTGSSGGSYTLTTSATVPVITGSITTSATNYNWANPNNEVMKINQTNPPTIEVKGNMVINGVDLEERLDTIEKVLQIPERDVKLESKHPKLKKMYDDYITALAKYRTWEAIKGDEDD
jgi:hypothetical protein